MIKFPNLLDIGLGLTFGTSVFAIIVEKNIGNIWYRDNDKGTKSIRPVSLIKFMLTPFYKWEMWTFPFIYNNYLIYSIFFTGPLIMLISFIRI